MYVVGTVWLTGVRQWVARIFQVVVRFGQIFGLGAGAVRDMVWGTHEGTLGSPRVPRNLYALGHSVRYYSGHVLKIPCCACNHLKISASLTVSFVKILIVHRWAKDGYVCRRHVGRNCRNRTKYVFPDTRYLRSIMLMSFVNLILATLVQRCLNDKSPSHSVKYYSLGEDTQPGECFAVIDCMKSCWPLAY